MHCDFSFQISIRFQTWVAIYSFVFFLKRVLDIDCCFRLHKTWPSAWSFPAGSRFLQKELLLFGSAASHFGFDLSCSPFPHLLFSVVLMRIVWLFLLVQVPWFSECLLVSPLASVEFFLHETQFPLGALVCFFFDGSPWQPQLSPTPQETLSQVSVISTCFTAAITYQLCEGRKHIRIIHVCWVQVQAQ